MSHRKQTLRQLAEGGVGGGGTVFSHPPNYGCRSIDCWPCPGARRHSMKNATGRKPISLVLGDLAPYQPALHFKTGG